MSVAVFTLARKGSQRCPNKMLRPFAGTSLTDLILQKFKQLEVPSFFAAHEPEFEEKCAIHGVDFVRRSQRSASIDGPIVEILACLREVDYDHLLLVNACLPMLRVETIQAFLDDCLDNDRQPAFAVLERRNFFMTKDGRPLNFDAGLSTINTKTVTPVLEFAHAFYFFDRRYFLETGSYWDWRTVRLPEAGSRLEMIDIDSEEDFQIAEAVWSHFHRHS